MLHKTNENSTRYLCGKYNLLRPLILRASQRRLEFFLQRCKMNRGNPSYSYVAVTFRVWNTFWTSFHERCFILPDEAQIVGGGEEGCPLFPECIRLPYPYMK